jgi:hypothetical protein
MKHLRISLVYTTLIIFYFMIQSQYSYSNYWCLSDDDETYRRNPICNKYKTKSVALENGSCLVNSPEAIDSIKKIVAIGSRNPEFYNPGLPLGFMQAGGYVENTVRLNKNQAGETLTYINSDAQICDHVTLSKDVLILGKSVISGNARIDGNAIISGKAKIMDDAYVTGASLIQGSAKISGSPLIRDFSVIKGNAQISGSVQIKDKAVIKDNVTIKGESLIDKNSEISGDTIVDSINPLAAELKEKIEKNKLDPKCNQNPANNGTQCYNSSVEFTELLFNGLRGKTKSCTNLNQYLVPELKPIQKTEINGRIFYIGPIVESSLERLVTVIYTPDENGCIIPQFLYKSLSDGGWRSCPGVEIEPNKYPHYIKGAYEFHKANFHYTQETKPHLKLVEAIENMDNTVYSTKYPLEVIFNNRELNKLGVGRDSYNLLIDYGDSARPDNDLTELQKWRPGFSFNLAMTKNPPNYRDIAANLDRTFLDLEKKGFVPDFKRPPLKSYLMNHSILTSDPNAKDVKVEVFPGKFKNKEIEWHIATDVDGRVWVDRIIYKDCEITRNGNCGNVIDSGIITNKPLEYKYQAGALVDQKLVTAIPTEKLIPHQIPVDTYVDITPLLNLLKPIRDYKASKLFQVQNPIPNPPDLDLPNQEEVVDSTLDLCSKDKQLCPYFDDEKLTSLFKESLNIMVKLPSDLYENVVPEDFKILSKNICSLSEIISESCVPISELIISNLMDLKNKFKIEPCKTKKKPIKIFSAE